MKRIVTSLPFRLLLGVVIGIIAGQLSGTALMNIVVTVKFVLGELINFCVPLIIIGFIAPSITRLGKNASRMLGAAVFCAYVSSILAAFLSMGAGYGLIPHLSVVTETDGLKELPELVFRLEIPQIMTVSQILYGEIPSVGTMILFCLLLGIFAIGAPGVPGGTVMASLGLITGILGFDSTGTALMLTIFALQDSFGTACNITGDGALTLILTGYADRHKIEKQDLKSVL